MATKITVEIKGAVTGFLRTGETEEQAKARIALEAEMRINSIVYKNCRDIRAHLGVKEEASYETSRAV